MRPLAAALLPLLLAAPALAGGYGYEGAWEAKGLTLRLTEKGEQVDGKLYVGAERPENEISVDGRIDYKTLDGSLWRAGKTYRFKATRRGRELWLRIQFDDGTRYYQLRPKQVRAPFRSVFTSSVEDLVLVLESQGGPIRGSLTYRKRRWQLVKVQPRSSGGLQGQLAGNGGAFTLTRSGDSPGAMILRWGRGHQHLVERAPELKSTYRGRQRAYTHPTFSCRIPADWVVGEAQPTGVTFGIPGPNNTSRGVLVVTIGPLEAADRGKRPKTIMADHTARFRQDLLKLVPIQLQGQPTIEEVAIDGQLAAAASWDGRAVNRNTFRLWIGLAVQGQKTATVVLIAQSNQTASLEPMAKLITRTLKITQKR